jgi:hypothetical protein
VTVRERFLAFFITLFKPIYGTATGAVLGGRLEEFNTIGYGSYRADVSPERFVQTRPARSLIVCEMRC